MTDPAYAPADVEMAEYAMAEAHCCCKPETRCSSHGIEAEAAVAALAAAGRLLPPDAEKRTEWGVRLTWDNGQVEEFASPTRHAAEARHDLHSARRAQGGWGVAPTLIRRDMLLQAGPWEEVPTNVQ